MNCVLCDRAENLVTGKDGKRYCKPCVGYLVLAVRQQRQDRQSQELERRAAEQEANGFRWRQLARTGWHVEHARAA